MIVLGKSSRFNADFVSPLFDPKYFSVYRVVLYLNEKSFLLSIFNTNGEILLIKTFININQYEVADFLGKICFEDELLKNKFASWEIIINSKKWMIVPSEFLPDGSEQAYLEQLYRINSNEVCFRNMIKPLSLNIIYAIDTELQKKAQYYFPDVEIRHTIASSILHYYKSATYQPTGYFAALELYENSFNYVVFNAGSLLYANQLHFDTPDDFLYNIILINNALSINEKNLEIIMTGINSQFNELKLIIQEHYPLYREIPNIYAPQIALEQQGFKLFQYAPLIFHYLENNKK